MNIYLNTERLCLRELTEADTDNLFALDSDPEVMRYIGPVAMDRVITRQWLTERIVPYYRQHPGYGFFGAMEKSTDAFLGWFILRPGLHYRFAAQVEFTENDVEIGYRLMHHAWGKGYGTEGAKALRDHAFDHLHIDCLAAVALKPNRASWNVMEKIGMEKAGEHSLPGYNVPAVSYRLCQKQYQIIRQMNL